MPLSRRQASRRSRLPILLIAAAAVLFSAALLAQSRTPLPGDPLPGVTPIEFEEFRMGLDVELEHGLRDPATNVTGDDPMLTGKIALAHLNEYSDYYTRLTAMERAAEEEKGKN